MKNYYLAVSVEENGKYYSYMIKTTDNENLLAVLERHKNLIHANIMPKERAEKVVAYWNQSYKDNGTYMFADGPFE